MSASTVIAFELKEPGHAVLRIWDAAGRAVRKLVDSQLSPGPVRVEWDGRTASGARAPAGIYLLDLRVNGNQVQSKVTLLSGR
jgi:flagellar hook assembly protein FlgD